MVVSRVVWREISLGACDIRVVHRFDVDDEVVREDSGQEYSMGVAGALGDGDRRDWRRHAYDADCGCGALGRFRSGFGVVEHVCDSNFFFEFSGDAFDFLFCGPGQELVDAFKHVQRLVAVDDSVIGAVEVGEDFEVGSDLVIDVHSA